MGNPEYCSQLAMELALSHDCERICAVDQEQLMKRNGESPEVISSFFYFSVAAMIDCFQVLVFTNSSYKKSLDEFCSVAFPLISMVFQEIVQSGVESIYIIFGDNYR